MKSLARNPRVLVVDDQEDVVLFLRHHAAAFGAEIDFVYARDVGEGIDALNEQCCDAALIDVCLVGVTGVSLSREIRKHDTLIPLAYFTNLDDDKLREQARLDRAYYLLKHEYQLTDDGPERLIETVKVLATANPCLPGGVRRTSLGFERKLDSTPFQLSEPFAEILTTSKMMAAAA